MKRATSGHDNLAHDDLAGLAQALVGFEDAESMRAFITDLCTPAELEALTDRWRVVPLLVEGIPYRQIHELTGVSVTTIGRVARHLEHGAGGYAAALAHTSPAGSTSSTRPNREPK